MLNKHPTTLKCYVRVICLDCWNPHGWDTVSSKQLPNEDITVPKNAIPDTPLILDTVAATSINKL